MAFIERLFALKATQDNTLKKALYSVYYNFGTPINSAQNFTQDLIKGYMKNEIVYSIVNKIADTASNVPVIMVDKEGKTLPAHWFNRLTEYTNDDTTWKELVFNYYVYLLSIGNSYIYAPTLSSGRTTELWTMPSDIVMALAGGYIDPIAGYKIIEGDQEQFFDKKDVIHGKLFNPRYQAGAWVYGLSPIEVAAEVIRGLNAGNERLAILLETGAPPFIISSQTPEGLTELQQEMLEKAYKRKFTDISKPNVPMMTGTPVKVERVGINPADLEIVNNSEHALRVLCNIYGVPSVLFNDNASSTYNNVSQARKDFYEFTIMPLNKMFAQKVKHKLFRDEDVYLKFDYSQIEVLQESFHKKALTLSTLWELTANEKRELLGYEPINDPAMDEILKPNNLEPIGGAFEDDITMIPATDGEV